MGKHSEGYWKRRWAQRCTSLGVEERPDAFEHPRFIERGREMASMMMEPLKDLSWPRSMFTDSPAAIAELMASDSPVPKIGRISNPLKCDNPLCGNRHNNAVSRVVKRNGNNHVLWYCNLRCRNRHSID